MSHTEHSRQCITKLASSDVQLHMTEQTAMLQVGKIPQQSWRARHHNRLVLLS
jgi:hypothetical protein